MRRWCWYCVLLLAITAIVALLLETKRLAELAGRFEVEARVALQESEATAVLLAAASADRAAAMADVTRLSGELAAATSQLQGMATVLQERTEEFTRAREAAAAAAARSLQPMSEGVRNCLVALHECLRAEGFANQRFLEARRLDADGLHEVEMCEVDGDGLGATFLYAGRMEAELDRSARRLELRFFDGHRFARGERTALPADGWPIVFQPIDARLIEQRLPYLVRCTGVHADPAAKGAGDSTDVDPMVRRQWLERFDRLLAMAGTTPDLRIGRFRGMAGGFFLQAELIGTDAKHRVVSSAHCARLAVEVDKATGVVSLLLQDGVLRSGGQESTITGEGYRMLLPNLDPKQASDVMFGMVVTR